MLLQTATDLYSRFSHELLWRRTLARVSVVLSFTLLALGLAASVRASFPNTELFVGNQYSGVVDKMWLAVAYAGAIGISITLNTYILYQLIGDFRGPGMIRALENAATEAPVVAWMDYSNPKPVHVYINFLKAFRDRQPEAPDGWMEAPNGEPENAQPKEGEHFRSEGTAEPQEDDAGSSTEEASSDDDDDELAKRCIEEQAAAEEEQKNKLTVLYERVMRGELTDPLGPLFEIAAYSIETRRLELVHASLTAVGNVCKAWIAKGIDPDRVVSLLLSHMSDLLEVAVHSGSHGQIEAMIRVLDGLAVSAIELPEPQSRRIVEPLSGELNSWARRLISQVPDTILSTAIESIARIAEVALGANRLETFDESALDLARLAELLSEHYEGAKGYRVLPRGAFSKEYPPSEALQDAMYRLVQAYSGNRRALIAYPLLLTDALYVCSRSFLEVSTFDEQAEHFSKSFVELLSDIALTAAKTLEGDALFKPLMDLRQLAEHRRFKSSRDLNYALAWRAMEIGMLTVANKEAIKLDRLRGTDLVSHIVKVCGLCSFESLQSAVGDLYHRGVSMYIPMPAQETFLQELEAYTGQSYRRFPR